MTLIKSEHGPVFGGFTSVSWRSPTKPTCVKDFRAFIFSLSHSEKFGIKHFNGPAVVHCKEFMAVFGRENLRDIFLQRNDDRKANNNTSEFGANYKIPKTMIIGSKEAAEHLSGSNLMFKITEIEVYKVIFKI